MMCFVICQKFYYYKVLYRSHSGVRHLIKTGSEATEFCKIGLAVERVSNPFYFAEMSEATEFCKIGLAVERVSNPFYFAKPIL